jgi:hypothetical protein
VVEMAVKAWDHALVAKVLDLQSRSLQHLREPLMRIALK